MNTLSASKQGQYLCQSRTSRRTWSSPGCRSSSSPSPSAAAPAEPSAPSAPSADGPSSALHVRPAPAASWRWKHRNLTWTHSPSTVSERTAKKDREMAYYLRGRRCSSVHCAFTPEPVAVQCYESVVCTLMWSWARLSRLRVVFLIESDDRGTCFLSCSRQCLSWARLQKHKRHCLSMQGEQGVLHHDPP